MRRIFTIATALVLGATATQAQTVATFDTLTLVGTDTFYVNYSNPGNDVGFDDGLAHFPTNYDTAGYKGLRKGFVYSNMTDSMTSGYTNSFSAKAAKGYNGSNQYLVASGGTNKVYLKGAAVGKPVKGFYATNTTYAYNSMRDGDAFARKFGDSGTIKGSHPDWFKLTVYGYANGSKKADSVDFYLADFRFADSTKDYILKTWEWVDLQSLGNVDSLEFKVTSSDVGQWGMNTPAFFCMDNFTTDETVSVATIAQPIVAKIYPNPAVDKLNIQLQNNSVKRVNVISISGKVIAQYSVTGSLTTINTSSLTSGMYLLQLVGENQNAVVRFVKQ
ncbi:MAG: DUF4465 domain-containing protein [Flavipsychrobacter sp.]